MQGADRFRILGFVIFLWTTIPFGFAAPSTVDDDPDHPRRVSRIVVVNLAGEPIPDASIVAGFFDATEANRRGLRLRDVSTTSDENGVFEWDHDKSSWIYSIWIRKPGYVKKQLKLHRPGEYSIVLDDAPTVLGRVVDEDGRPVEGAAVSEVIGNDVPTSPLWTVTTNHDGIYQWSLTPNRSLSLVAVARNGLTGSVFNVPVNGDFEIVVKSSRSVAVEVLDELDRPMPNVQLELASWSQTKAVDWKGKSDATGRVTWDQAPRGKLVISAHKEGYCVGWAIVDSEQNETTKIKMIPPQTFEGKVIDEDFNSPISEFVVKTNYRREVNSSHKLEKTPVSTIPDELKGIFGRGIYGTRGSFEFTMDTSFDSLQLEIYALGYPAYKSEFLSRKELTQFKEFRLRSLRAAHVEKRLPQVTVKNPNGSPATDARVVFMDDNSELSIGAIRSKPSLEDFILRQDVALTDERGRIHYDPEKYKLLVAWNEQGFVSVAVSDLISDGNLPMEAWAEVSVQYPSELRDSLSKYFMRSVISKAPNGLEASIQTWLEPSSAESSGFRKQRIPPRTTRLIDQRWDMNMSISQVAICEFQPIQGKLFDLNLVGTSTIRGNLSFPSDALVQSDPCELNAKRVDSQNPSSVVYRIIPNADGSFEFANILAGRYELSIPPIPRPGLGGAGGPPAGMWTSIESKIVDQSNVDVKRGEVAELGFLEVVHPR